MVTSAQHDAALRSLADSFSRLDPTVPVRLAKGTTNLFRPRAPAMGPGLDVSTLTGVLDVDPVEGTATVQGMATYERVVDATLAAGVMPLVVPQLRTITVGGAVTGLGIESSSFRNGLPHESVRSMDILVGTGEIVTATPGGPHADLYRAFRSSLGSLGYAVSLTIEVEPVAPFVRLRHVAFDSLGALTDAIGHLVTARAWDGEPVDFLDGVVFARNAAYLTLGRFEQTRDAAETPSDYAGQRIFYRSIREQPTDLLTVRDYLWRWDTDWFWCSRAFGVQHPVVRRLWPRQLKRSDVYQRIVGLENRYHVAARVDSWRGRPARERVVQDVEIPLERTADFLDWFCARCPSSRSGCAPWPCASRASPGRLARGHLTSARPTAMRRGRSIRCAAARPTSTSASGRACRSAQVAATATSTATSRASCPSSAGTSRSTPTPTTPERTSNRVTAVRYTRT